MPMNNRTNIPAFSILEAVVGLVVSSIIIGLVFVVFTILSERMIDFRNQNQYTADLNRLTYSFNKDIFENEVMKPSDSGVVFYSYDGKKTVYRNLGGYLLRNQNDFTDTFRVAVKRFRLDTVANKNRTTAFERLSLEADLNAKQIQLKFFKKIYADQLLKKLKNEF